MTHNTNNIDVVDQFQAAAYSAYHSVCEAYNKGLIQQHTVELASIAREHADEAMLCDAAGWTKMVVFHIECAVDIFNGIQSDLDIAAL